MNRRPLLTIDLGALRENYLRLRRMAAPARCACVVKADAYGLGAGRAVTALREAGCQDFFVATLDEGLALRGLLGPGPRIRILNGIPRGSAEEFLESRLDPVLNHLEEVREWSRCARRTGRRLPGLLHLDTGMSRLGLPAREQRILREDPSLLEPLRLALAMSHLAHGADPVLSGDQRRAFEEARAPWKRVPASLANSEGILLGREFHYQMARPGIALYGGLAPFREVASLQAPVIQVRDVPAGAAVGYDGTWKACGPARIATIPVGYADGLIRSCSNRAAAWIGERRAPVAGRISMDLATLDVTGIPGVRPGTPATLLGGPATLQDLARASGTIPYEILVSLGRGRFTRRYLPPVEACGRSPGSRSP